MEGRCDKHPFEHAEDRCGRCGSEYCPECLVYPFGASRAPYCIPCAVASAGIRTAARGSLPRSEQRRLEKERKAALKAARKAAKQPTPATAPTVEAEAATAMALTDLTPESPLATPAAEPLAPRAATA